MKAITGEYLRRLRLEAGLTQDRLAALSGLSQSHISKIEEEQMDPRLSTVNKMLEALGELETRSIYERLGALESKVDLILRKLEAE